MPASDVRMMLISKQRQAYAPIDAEKVGGGRFYTTGQGWLYPQVCAFIQATGAACRVDPFAGRGDLLAHAAAELGACPQVGYDLDPKSDAIENDSLLDIPSHPQSVILTNPPYLARHSAKRKRVWNEVARYFKGSHTDLYQVALDRCLASCPNVVAIIPETFLNSSYPKERLRHVTVAERSLFHDTDCPVCVACFDGEPKASDAIEVFRDEVRLGNLGTLEASRLKPAHSTPISFNDPHGTITLRAIDLPDPGKPIAFMRREDSDYPVSMIKVSSRLVTFLSMPRIHDHQRDALINAANRQLAAYRERTADVTLSPFKGNRKDGRRRRRLDYATARALLELAAEEVLQTPSSDTGLLFPVRSS